MFQQLGQQIPAVALNFFKGVIAIICITLILVPYGFSSIPRDSFLLLSLSGLVGICLGDTFYFLAINRLGSRLTLLIGTLIPVVSALIAFMLLKERIPFGAVVGLSLTITGVAYVLWDRTEIGSSVSNWKAGLFFAALFVLTNALGIIFTKVGVENVPSLDATLVRTFWAVLGLLFWGLVTRSLVRWSVPIKEKKIRNRLLVASLVGAFLGTWFSVLALKFTHTAVAVTLNSTSPIFVLPLAAWILKERVSRRAISGAIAACLGVAAYFFSIMQ